MTLEELGRAAHRLLADRLDLLKGSLGELGIWFKEHVARLIGQHVGAAVRDALAAVLGRHAHHLPDDYDRDEGQQRFGLRDPQSRWHPRRHQEHDSWDMHPEESDTEPEPETNRSVGRWEAALSCGLQLFSWWLHQGLSRSLLPRVLALGAVAVLVTLLLGPLAGGVLVTAGTALLAGFSDDEINDPMG